MIRRIITSLAGALLIVYGVIAALSPLPAGALLIVLGMVMIALANPAARPLIRTMRRKWPWFDRLATALGRRGPAGVRSLVEATKPDDTILDREDRDEGDGHSHP